MPKKHYRAEQRKTLRLQAKREGISLGELQKRLKSDGDTMEQEAGEGLWTATEAGQDGAAEEGGNGMDDSASLSLFVMATSPPFPLETMPPLYSTAATTSTTADCPDDDGGGVAASVVARRLLKRAGVLRLEASTTKRALQDGRRRQKDAIDVDTDRIIELLMLLASSSDGVAAIAVAVGPSSSSSLLLPQLILPLPNDSFFYKFYWTNPSETSLHPSAST